MATKNTKQNKARAATSDELASSALAALNLIAPAVVSSPRGGRAGKSSGSVTVTFPFRPGVRVYVAAPYDDAPRVRGVHGALRRRGLVPTSRWADDADGPEQLGELPIGEIRRALVRNTCDLLASDVVLALPQKGKGGEMFAEIARALEANLPVIWVGARRILSAYDRGVLRVRTVADAFAALERMAAEGRGALREAGRK